MLAVFVLHLIVSTISMPACLFMALTEYMNYKLRREHGIIYIPPSQNIGSTTTLHEYSASCNIYYTYIYRVKPYQYSYTVARKQAFRGINFAICVDISRFWISKTIAVTVQPPPSFRIDVLHVSIHCCV